MGFFKEAALFPDLHLARVISQYKNIYLIVTNDNEIYAEISGKFRFSRSHLSDYPAVGDFVMVDRTNDNSGNAIIQHVLTRKSAFERTAVGTDGEMQVIAANIDFVFICMSLNNDFNLNRLERYLSVAWGSQATPVIVLTKADLCDDLPSVLTKISAISLGAETIVTSIFDQTSVEKLQNHLKDGITASFIGSSGVGKTSLINSLTKQDELATSEIRAGDDKGRHTTTRRELFVLSQGGIVIDTPGMRELGAESAYVSKSFSDIDKLISNCRFNDCTHTNEPGCAIRQALETGVLDERRFNNYQKIKRESKYDSLSSKRIDIEKVNSMFGSKADMKRARDFCKEKNKRR